MILLVSLALGILIGLLLRRQSSLLAWADRLSGLVVYLLLFLLGLSVGSDRALLASLHTLGLQAFVLSAGAISGSVLLSAILYRSLFHEK